MIVWHALKDFLEMQVWRGQVRTTVKPVLRVNTRNRSRKPNVLRAALVSMEPNLVIAQTAIQRVKSAWLVTLHHLKDKPVVTHVPLAVIAIFKAALCASHLGYVAVGITRLDIRQQITESVRNVRLGSISQKAVGLSHLASLATMASQPVDAAKQSALPQTRHHHHQQQRSQLPHQRRLP
jgi:hypothetical protein